MTPYYDKDGITIYHGDCRDVLPTLPKVDLVLTDPPYSMQHVDGGGFAAATAFYRDGKLKGMDSFALSDFAESLVVASDQIVAFHSRDSIREWADFCAERFGKYDLHVWHKTNAIPFTHNTWKSDLEYIAVGWRKKNHQPAVQAMKSKAWVSPLCNDSLHPTCKPIPLLAKYIAVLTDDSSTVLDPFMGSGTTLRAAKDLGRKAIGIEIEERYCEIAAKRLAQEVFTFA